MYRVIKRVYEYEATTYIVQKFNICEDGGHWESIHDFDDSDKAKDFMTRLANKEITEDGDEIIASID